MPPKRTSTSETPAITLAAIRQLVADSVATALKAQAANMANTDNTNKNTGTSGTPVARKGINNHKRKFEDRAFNGTKALSTFAGLSGLNQYFLVATVPKKTK
ncbi:hypothetical protein Tco_0344942 [Tanacetum coccineum]